MSSRRLWHRGAHSGGAERWIMATGMQDHRLDVAPLCSEPASESD